MKLVMLVVARDDADVIDAQLAFHLNAGVDLMIVTDHDSTDGTSDILESYAREGYVRRLREHGAVSEAEWRAKMCRLAVEEYAADWVIDGQVDEFWLPRAESLKAVLGAIPLRYGVVQALARVFLPQVDTPEPWFDRLTVRRPLLDLRTDESAGRLDWALRPICRAVDGAVSIGSREAALGGGVPLRAWYPIEVLRFPLRSSAQAERHVAGRSGSTIPRSRVEMLLSGDTDGAVERPGWDEVALAEDEVVLGVEAGAYVVDERLRHALTRIERVRTANRGYALPGGSSDRLVLHTPSVVEDIGYAEECAVVREVDLDAVRKDVQDLEGRIASLERRFWPRVTRTLSRVLRR